MRSAGAPEHSTESPQSSTARPRSGTGRKVLRTAVSAALIGAAFGFVLPHVASYGSVWASLQAMTWPHTLLIAIAAVPAWRLLDHDPGDTTRPLRLRQAAVLNLGSNAVANASARRRRPGPGG